MLLNEKITIIRKMNNLTQERFAEELGVSRQAVSKWENATSVPDVQMLLRIADHYNLTLDQLVRDDLPMPQYMDNDFKENEITSHDEFCIKDYLGKICDVSMNSFIYSVLRNVQIVGITGNMVCFIKKKRYGYFNQNKSLGILIKKSSPKYALFAQDQNERSFWGATNTFLGWYMTEDSIMKEIEEIRQALICGSDMYELKYSIKARRTFLSVKVKQ